MKQKKWIEYQKRTLPEEQEVECKKCGRNFYDEFNLLSLATLDMCLLCANRNLDKAQIKEKYHVE